MSMQSDEPQTPIEDPPVPVDEDPIPPPSTHDGCACIAHSVYAVRKDGSTRQIDIPQDPLEFTPRANISNLSGARGFSTLLPTGLWNGRDLTIPVTGIYYTEVSFVRDVGEHEDDVYLHIMRQPAPPAPKQSLGFAWAGQSAGLGNMSERQTGHFSIVTMLDAGDELSVRAGADTARDSHVANVRWTTFALCCDPSIEVKYPC